MRCSPLLLVAILVACGGPQRDRDRTAAPPPDAGPPPVDRAAMAELADAVLEVLIAMADVVEARTGDCDAIAVELGVVFDHADVIVAAVRDADADPAQHAVLLEEMDARAAKSTGLAERIGLGLQPCQGHAGVIEVMQRMPTF